MNNIRNFSFISILFALVVGLSGCTMAASAIINSTPEVNERRLEKAQAYGYIAYIKTEFANQKLELNVANLRNFIVTDLSTVDSEGFKTAARIYEMPNFKLYLISLKRLDKEDRLIGKLDYSFESATALYEALPYTKGIPFYRLADYVVSLRTNECRSSDFVEFDGVKFLNNCKIDEGEYSVQKWVSFDKGLYFPKEFSFTNGWKEKVSFITEGAKELTEEKVAYARQEQNRVVAEVKENIAKGLVERVTDIQEAKLKLQALAVENVLYE